MRRMRFKGMRFVLFGMIGMGVVGLTVSGLWNVLMPEIFGLPAIGFWQALGLFLLSRLLFGRFNGWGSRMAKARFVRGWKDLTPEERKRFRSAMETCRAKPFGQGETPESVS